MEREFEKNTTEAERLRILGAAKLLGDSFGKYLGNELHDELWEKISDAVEAAEGEDQWDLLKRFEVTVTETQTVQPPPVLEVRKTTATRR